MKYYFTTQLHPLQIISQPPERRRKLHAESFDEPFYLRFIFIRDHLELYAHPRAQYDVTHYGRSPHGVPVYEVEFDVDLAADGHDRAFDVRAAATQFEYKAAGLAELLAEILYAHDDRDALETPPLCEVNFMRPSAV
jgi:hypothetical protein